MCAPPTSNDWHGMVNLYTQQTQSPKKMFTKLHDRPLTVACPCRKNPFFVHFRRCLFILYNYAMSCTYFGWFVFLCSRCVSGRERERESVCVCVCLVFWKRQHQIRIFFFESEESDKKCVRLASSKPNLKLDHFRLIGGHKAVPI